MITKLNYFGTSLTQKGHYIFTLEGENIRNLDMSYSDMPVLDNGALQHTNGTVFYIYVNGYSICYIVGSCADTRHGCKSMFWVDGYVNMEEWKDIILSIPIAKKIIEQMPFDVKW